MTTHSHHFQSVGQRYHDFKLTSLTPIPELQCILRELVHEPSGAHVLHIENDDPENLFCLSFQTLPYNSNGVAHILEHTVLCGSKKFPVKDPFFGMSRRSLNTFMNALTGADFTCYPAASQVHKDFYNLLEVYLDAVFNPLLNEYSFLQEGYRLEFSDPTDSTTPLVSKGIVFNEMKGALASGAARLSEALNAALFPDITYGCNSGGDPIHITQLTYEELKQFHQTFYHPSRCLFFFYGNMPLEGHLDFIAEHTLKHASPAPPLPPIPFQPRFNSPVYQKLTYPIAPDEDPKDKTLIAFGWLTCHILDQQDTLGLSILEITLMDTDASPLKYAFLQSGLCKQASSFIDTELHEIPWAIVLKGCKPESADALEELLKQTLKKISLEGIPLQSIENAIHQLEFYRSEITGDHAPFGLSLFMRSALQKQHGADPAEGLKIHSLFEHLRKIILAEPNYFKNLIQKYLLDNPHFIRIVMRPDPELNEKENELEKKYLAKVKEELSPAQKKEIIEQASALAEFQKKQEEEDFDLLPKVSLQDIPVSAKNYHLTQEKVGELTVFHHNVFTNDIVYADLTFNLPNLLESDLSYLRLFTVVLTQIGCADRSYQENLEYIQENTGGISAGINLYLQASDHLKFNPSLHIRGKSLYRKAPKLFALLKETAESARFDDLKRLKEILIKHFSGLESAINQSALKYAINLSASSLNSASKVANDLYGLEYFWKIRELVNDFENQSPYLLSKLQQIQEMVTCLEDPHLILSCPNSFYQDLKNKKFYGLSEIKTSPYEPWKGDFPLIPVEPQGRQIASPVAFIGDVFPTVSYVHPDSPALNLAAFLFDNVTLHSKIREQGGAYGGGAVSNPMSGNFYFYSYRDPNIVSTFKAFHESVQAVLDGDFDDSDLEEAKFEMIQGLDTPIAPGSQAEVAYGWLREGRTYEIRQAFRTRLLSLTREEVIEAVKSIIAPRIGLGTPIIFAGKKLLEKANQDLIAEGKPPFNIYTI